MNYREVLRKNSNKTIFVVIAFLLLYSCVGYLVDIFIQWPELVRVEQSYAGLSGLFKAILDFKIYPMATFLMLVIGAISIVITFSIHDKMIMWGSEYKEININAESNIRYSLEEKRLYNVVEEMKIAGNLKFMPKVYLIEANYMNAFASGYSEKSAMVAITKGLMNKLNRDELQAVMAHEISHIKHLDIKLTLFVGVLSNVMIMVLDTLIDIFRITGGNRSSNNNSSDKGANAIVFLIIIAARIIFPMLATCLQLSLSRTREYMADAGAVQMTRDREAMASALLKIHDDYASYSYEDKGVDIRKAAYIYNPIIPLFGSLLSTHPTIEERLKALGMRKLLREYEKRQELKNLED